MASYREYPPHPALAGHVACLWTSQAGSSTLADGASWRTRILPDNCIDILWREQAPLGAVVGMMSRVREVTLAPAATIVAVRLRPGAARAFFDLPLQLLQDESPALDALWPRAEAEALAAALWERERSVAQQLAVLERALLARLQAHLRAQALAPASARVAGLVRTALDLLDASGGALRVDDLAGRLHVSRQHLALHFRERVGLSPKTFARICQFRRAHAALRRLASKEVDWARLAADCGYYDQSHLVHAFRQFAGATPARFHFSNTPP